MDEYQMELSPGFGESYQNCPACGKEMVAGHSECFSCGVVVNRYESRKSTATTKSAVGGIDHLTEYDLKRLEKLWKQVVVNYHDQASHDRFIDYCQKNGALPFASFQYTRMLGIDAEDDIAQLMRRQVLSRLTAKFETVQTPPVERTWHWLNMMLKWATWVGLTLSSGCVVAGMLLPANRNLIGLGVSFLSLFIALSIFRKRRS